MSLTKDTLYTIASDSLDRKYDEVRRTVLADNPDLVSFDIRRSGDDVTVVFGLRRGGDRYDFRLFGNKHDYYRMSMGVRLEETFALLARVDPNVEAGGVTRDGEILRLTLRPAVGAGAGAEAASSEPRRGPAPAEPPEKAAAADRRDVAPPGTDGEVPAPGTTAMPAVGSVQVTGPREGRAGVPQPRGDASDEDSETAYREARREGTLQAWSRFLAEHPDSPRAPEAGERAAALREDAAYRTALERDDASGYQAFLDHFPASGRAPEIEARLKLAQEARTRAVVERRVREQEQGRRAEAYAQAKKLDTPEAYRMFLTIYPDAPEAADARRRMNRAETRSSPPPSEAGNRTPPGRPPSPVLTVPPVPKGPTVDGNAADAAWKGAPALAVPLTGGGRSIEARVRAVHDGVRVYLLAEWPDGTEDALYRPWTWDEQKKTYVQADRVDDGFAVALYRSSPDQACKLNGEEQEADTWLWRAFWSSVAGHADDGVLRVSRQRLPHANPYPTASGSGQVWIREEPDDGPPPWALVIPVEFQGAEVASYRKQSAAGSRGDVLAAGRWTPGGARGGTWAVEMSRALDTGHADDVPLRAGTRQPAAFAVFDRSEKGRHVSSELIQLDIRGR